MCDGDVTTPDQVCPHVGIHAAGIARPLGILIFPAAGVDAHRAIVTSARAARSLAETPKKTRAETMHCEISSGGCAGEADDPTQHLSYSSRRCHHMPISLRPFGARSSHWYMPQRPSSPRA